MKLEDIGHPVTKQPHPLGTSSGSAVKGLKANPAKLVSAQVFYMQVDDGGQSRRSAGRIVVAELPLLGVDAYVLQVAIHCSTAHFLVASRACHAEVL